MIAVRKRHLVKSAEQRLIMKQLCILCAIGLGIITLIEMAEAGPGGTIERMLWCSLWLSFLIPPMAVLWLTLTVALKKLSPFFITFNCAFLSVSINGLLLVGLLALLNFSVEPKRLTNTPELVTWSLSFLTCALGYWWILGRIPKMRARIISGQRYVLGNKIPAAAAKRLPDGLNVRNSLYIALFMSALQQPYYYLVYKFVSNYYNEIFPISA